MPMTVGYAVDFDLCRVGDVLRLRMEVRMEGEVEDEVCLFTQPEKLKIKIFVLSLLFFYL